VLAYTGPAYSRATHSSSTRRAAIESTAPQSFYSHANWRSRRDRLAWHTGAVYRTLNEARRIEPERAVNGALWELLTAGYAHLMTFGIRRLVDRNPSTDSVWNVIAQIEKRPELLRRENFICYDGLSYDHAAAYRRYAKTLDLSSGGHAGWVTTTGPEALGNFPTSAPILRRLGRLSTQAQAPRQSAAGHPNYTQGAARGRRGCRGLHHGRQTGRARGAAGGEFGRCAAGDLQHRADGAGENRATPIEDRRSNSGQHVGRARLSCRTLSAHFFGPNTFRA
jgi:hypothetical protein